jgi:hypothetical protein
MPATEEKSKPSRKAAKSAKKTAKKTVKWGTNDGGLALRGHVSPSRFDAVFAEE